MVEEVRENAHWIVEDLRSQTFLALRISHHRAQACLSMLGLEAFAQYVQTV